MRVINFCVFVNEAQTRGHVFVSMFSYAIVK